MRVLLERAHREPVGTGAQRHVEDAPRTEGAGCPRREGGDALAGQTGGDGARQVGRDAPVVAHAGRRLEDGARPARDVSHRDDLEEQVVVVALEAEGRRQEHVRVARRLVPVDVERHHRVELREGARQALSVGHGRDGVARERDERADVARLDLLGQAGDGELAAELGQPADTAPVRAEAARWPRSVPRRTTSTAGVVNIAPPGPVEVAR